MAPARPGTPAEMPRASRARGAMPPPRQSPARRSTAPRRLPRREAGGLSARHRRRRRSPGRRDSADRASARAWETDRPAWRAPAGDRTGRDGDRRVHPRRDYRLAHPRGGNGLLSSLLQGIEQGVEIPGPVVADAVDEESRRAVDAAPDARAEVLPDAVCVGAGGQILFDPDRIEAELLRQADQVRVLQG